MWANMKFFPPPHCSYFWNEISRSGAPTGASGEKCLQLETGRTYNVTELHPTSPCFTSPCCSVGLCHGATSRSAILKSLASIFQVRRLQFVSILSILNHPCFFAVYYYHLKVILVTYGFQGSFNLKVIHFVRGQNNSKNRDWTPLKFTFINIDFPTNTTQQYL